MSNRVVLFDGSGTLFDDLMAGWKTAMTIFSDYGLNQISLREFRRNVCEPHWRFFSRFGVPLDAARNSVPALIREVYDGDAVKPFPDVSGALAELKGFGARLGVVSQTPREIVIRLLRRFSLSDYFDVIVALEDCAEEKPSPEPLQMALDSLSVRNQNEAAYVGDMREDIRAAKAAKVTSIAVSRKGSFHTPQQLKRERPDYIVHNVSDLVSLPII